MSIVGKLFSGTAKKSSQVSTSLSPQIMVTKKAIEDSLSKNLSELENFTQSQMPQINASHSAALEGLEQLSKNIRSML